MHAYEDWCNRGKCRLKSATNTDFKPKFIPKFRSTAVLRDARKVVQYITRSNVS